MSENKTQHKVAVIPGDGIGKEVVPAAVDVLNKLAANHGIGFDWTWFDWSCEHYHAHGQMMPAPARVAAP